MAFLGNIALGKYLATGSPLHRLDPRTKFLAVLVLMAVLLASHRLLPLLLAIAFLSLLVRLARIPQKMVIANLRAFLWLFFFTFVLHALMPPGTVFWRLPYLGHTLTFEGLERGAVLSLRLAAVIVTVSLLTLTTAPLELTAGLERLFRPLARFGFPAGETALMISIALRFIPVLIDETERLYKAQLARGADFSGNLFQRVRNLLPLLVPMFVSAFGHADRLALAMECRGYQPNAPRTSYRPLRFASRDLYAILLVLAAAGLLAWLPLDRLL